MIVITATLAPMTVFAADNPLNITVEQAVNISSDVTFNYTLRSTKPGNPMPSGSAADGYSFSITGNDSKGIGPMNYEKQGVYRYEIFQVIDTEKPGWSYDRRVFTIEVHVDAALKVSMIVINVNGEKEGEIMFENAYIPAATDRELMVDPPVRKIVTGNPNNDSTFTFRLTAHNPSNPMPEGSRNGIKELSITGSGEKEFGTWSYDREGVYYYSVSEVNSGNKDYTYDTAIYTIIDTVTDDNGQLVLSRVVTDDTNQNVTSLDFVNSYSPDNGNTSRPKTGDDAKTALYIVLVVVNGAAVIGTAAYLALSKKCKTDNEDN